MIIIFKIIKNNLVVYLLLYLANFNFKKRFHNGPEILNNCQAAKILNILYLYFIFFSYLQNFYFY